MTGKERITRILKHQPVDRVGLFEHFWGDTYSKWVNDGFIRSDEYFEDHFNLDIMLTWGPSFVADLDYEPEVVAETEDTITIKDGNYAILKHHKKHDTTPEHIDFTVKCYDDWKEYIKPILKVERRRIDFEGYRRAKQKAAEENKFFVLASANVFELMHPVTGHENLLVGMALEPEWIEEMCETYSNMLIEMQQMLFEEEGYPDGIWYYEDMGYKHAPFMSPAMYEQFLFPAHKKTIDFAHEHGMPVIMHSCGFVEPLLPKMVEAGIDCLQVIEIKAGMDLLRIYENFGDKIALMGGIDVRTLYTNDKEMIDRELEAKIPIVKNGFGYVVHSDHSIPATVNYETYRYFIDKALELGKYE